ncbi:MAG: hypothetical protein QM820_48170 [Minicystis sp.]
MVRLRLAACVISPMRWMSTCPSGEVYGMSACAKPCTLAKRPSTSLARAQPMILIELRRDVAPVARHGHGLVAGDGQHERGHLALEGRARREELVEDRAEGPHVRARVDVLRLAHQLRRRVAGEAEHRGRGQLAPGHGRGGLAHQLGGAEVDDLHLRRAAEALRQEEVRRLQLAEQDAVGVALGHGLRGLEDVEHRVRQRERAALLEGGREVLAFEVLPGEEEGAVLGLADVDDAGDVLRLQLGERAGLAPKALDLLLVHQGGREHADGDPLIELGMESFDQEAPRTAQDRAYPVLPCDDVARFDRLGSHALSAADGRVVRRSPALWHLSG